MKILPLLAVYIKYHGIVVHINHHINEINKKEMYAVYKHLSFGNMYFIPCDSHEIIPCKSLSVTDQGHKPLWILKSTAACVFRECFLPAAPRMKECGRVVKWAHSKETWGLSDSGLRACCSSCENFLWLHHSSGCLDPTSLHDTFIWDQIASWFDGFPSLYNSHIGVFLENIFECFFI